MGIVMEIRIIGTPDGEAPEEVRRAWIGLVLPVAPGFEKRRFAFTSGVLSRPQSLAGWLWALFTGRFKERHGYVVDASVAVEKLAAHAPDAARWWHEKARGALQPG